jgi:hypothetical protein
VPSCWQGARLEPGGPRFGLLGVPGGSCTEQRASELNGGWFAGILLGTGVEVALGVALDNVAVGIAMGAGVGVALAAGLARRDRR